MTELAIEPEHWNRTDERRRPVDELLVGFDALRAFIDATAEAEAGAVVYVT